MAPDQGPAVLTAVRHGESTGNAAFAAAAANGTPDTGITCRDADLSLTALGRAQSTALGRHLAERSGAGLPQSVWCSPYLRTRETAELILTQFDRAGLPLPSLRFDERLRDRDQGVLELLTAAAIELRHPEEAARRRRVGDLYYRPPGGESWSDLALRLRSLLADLSAEEPDRRVLLVTHDAVILILRYLIEHQTESDLPQDGSPHRPANASLTRWLRASSGGTLHLDCYNATDHLPADP